MSTRFIICENRKIDFTANAKVNSDIVSILTNEGFVPLVMRRFFLPVRGTQRVLSLCWWLYSRFILLRMRHAKTVVVQYPNSCARFERFGLSFFTSIAKKSHLILLVQDLDMPRFAGDNAQDSEGCQPVLKMARIAFRIIVHNAVMREWFVQRGIDKAKIIELLTFDYLALPQLKKSTFSHAVTLAGNLAPNKAAYAARLKEIKGVQWRIFSPYFDESAMGGDNITYAGVCKAEEFPKLLNYGFGLVWDGDSVDGCTGNAGKYTLMVSPHKMALYLASGLPVIVSEDAAVSDFVRKSDVGITVKSLRDLPKVLSEITEARYSQLAANALDMAHKLRDGYFTKRAITEAMGEATK